MRRVVRRLAYRLTLAWRTAYHGPICQLCEQRHHSVEWEALWCAGVMAYHRELRRRFGPPPPFELSADDSTR